MSISLQIERLPAESIALDANVLFESTTSLSGNIAYHDTTGMLIFLLL